MEVDVDNGASDYANSDSGDSSCMENDDRPVQSGRSKRNKKKSVKQVIAELCKKLRVELGRNGATSGTVEIIANPPSKVGLLYTPCSASNSNRTLVIYVELSKSVCSRSECCACVRYVLDSSRHSTPSSFSFMDLKSTCSCSPRYVKDCPHRNIISKNVLLKNEVCFILGMNRLLNVQNGLLVLLEIGKRRRKQLG